MTRSCTLCDVDMDARRRAGVEVDICANCMGLYLDAGEFDTVIGLQFGGRRYESTFDFVADDVANPRRCAGCAGPMRRAEFDGVRVDYCPGCGGVWIDGAARRELERRRSSDEVSPELAARVECSGCGELVAQRLCIRRWDQQWCETCVVAGNHPGPEAQLVGRTKMIGAASRSYASAQASLEKQRAFKEQADTVRRGTGQTGGDHGTLRSEPAVAVAIARAVDWVLQLFVRDA